jgi:hypothetical protein
MYCKGKISRVANKISSSHSVLVSRGKGFYNLFFISCHEGSTVSSSSINLHPFLQVTICAGFLNVAFSLQQQCHEYLIKTAFTCCQRVMQTHPYVLLEEADR